MAKVATNYLKTEAFRIVEEGFHRERNKVSESIFSLANEYMGIRGTFDEGISLDSLKGSYFNGIYEYALQDTPIHYKGIIQRTHFMINSVNWIKTIVKYQDIVLDLAKVNFNNFYRILDMKSGLLTRSFDWYLEDGKIISFKFERFLNMNDVHRCYQKIEIEANFDGELELTLALDNHNLHWGSDYYYKGLQNFLEDEKYGVLNETLTTKQRLLSLMKIITSQKVNHILELEKEVSVNYRINFKKEQKVTFIRYVINIAQKDEQISNDDLYLQGIRELDLSVTKGYEQALKENQIYWNEVFDKSDIEIIGDELNQQGIRYCIFQLQQTYHGISPTNNIGAKGLTGEAYSGHAFWDTETYCLPFYLLNNLQAALDLLLYRYHTLEMAKKRAIQLDCIGACYPIATLDGNEACNLWQHASLQLQPSTGVSYGIYHYMRVSKDENFLIKYGLEMLLEISKFLLSRGQWSQSGKDFGYYGVMGPDEFQLMVNHNTYTNYMAKKTFEYTLEVISNLKEKYNLDSILEKCQIDEQILKQFEKAAKHMRILYDPITKKYEQHEGFYDLPHIDIKSIPVTDFPLYSHWSYDRIYRNDIIKQPDVLMFIFLYNQEFDLQVKKANYEYYEPRCIHESSLSPSVHSILACELGKIEEALDFFGFATRMDLDDYNRNTCEGLHMTSIAAAWLNIVYGFGGVRSDGILLSLSPILPKLWKKYSFNFTHNQTLFKVEVDTSNVIITNKSDKPCELIIYGQKQMVNKQLIITRS